MAVPRTWQEKMDILNHCMELEKTGGDILGYLWSQDYLTPRATWCNYQREFLHRKPYEFTDGKPKKKGARTMNGMNRKTIAARQKRLDELKQRIGAGMGIRAALADMGYTGQSAGQTYRQIRNFAQENDPEAYAILPEKISDADTPVVISTPEMPTVKVDGPLNIETPEAGQIQVAEAPETYIKITKDRIEAGVQKKIEMAVCCEELEISAVRHPQLGEFYFDHDHNSIDWRDPFGDEVSVSPDLWKKMHETLPKILNALGVEL